MKALWTAALVADQIENDNGVTRGTRTMTEERKRRLRKIRISEKDISTAIHSSESTKDEVQNRVSKNAFRGSSPKITIHITVTSANHILLENTADYPVEEQRAHIIPEICRLEIRTDKNQEDYQQDS